MDLYALLADHYDDLMSDFDYASWAGFFTRLTAGRDINTVVDLGCGTGVLTALLAGRGYDLIGVDACEAMLSAACDRPLADGAVPPLWLAQRMEELDLYGTADACVCCLDGFNHLQDADALRQTLERVKLFLNPGGVLLFDILTPAHFAAIDGRSYVLQADGCHVSWTCDCGDADCVYDFTVFTRQGNGWRRGDCHQRVLILQPEAVKRLLESLGFTVTLYADRSESPPAPDEARIFVLATV